VGIVIAGAVFAGVLALSRAGGAGRIPITVEGPMPAIEGPGLRGEPVAPGDFRGKVTLVNFWASWCGPCRHEQPALERLAKELDGVGFVGINFRDDPAAALEYLREFDVSYPSVEDRDGALAHAFLVPYLPATILVDEAGEMRYRLVGPQTEETFRRYLAELLSD